MQSSGTHPGRTIVVGITGGSASGKTTFTRALADRLADFGPAILNQDRYFRDWAEYPPEERARVRTSNHPRGVLWAALVSQVEALASGRPVREPVAGTRAGERGDPEQVVQPSCLVVVEGHLIFWHEPLRERMDLRIYVDADAHERALRRMLRDTASGGMDLDGAAAWYRRDVIPNFPVYTASTRRYADLIVPYDGENSVAVRAVASGIRRMLERGPTCPSR